MSLEELNELREPYKVIISCPILLNLILHETYID